MSTAADEIKDVMDELGKGFAEFKDDYNARLKAEREEREALERKFNMQRVSGTKLAIEKPEAWLDVKSRQPVPVLTHKMRLADLAEAKGGADDSKPQISVGRMLRGMVLGNRADDRKEIGDEFKALAIVPDSAGGYTVPWGLSAQWIDLLRAAMVLSQAGARTIPMPSRDLTIARVTGDPTISWHGENAGLTDSGPTFGALNLSAKTVVCLVKFSLELAQDSANIEQILQSVLTNATAQAIDSAGLVGVTPDAALAPSGIMNLGGRNAVTSIGAPTSWDFLVDGMYELMLDDVPMDSIGAFISHPAVWKKMRKLKTGITNDNTPLTMPAEVTAVPKLWTTAAPLTGGTTAKGIIANWSDLLFGVRQDINVRVLSETFMGSNLQLAMLVYARVDFGAARADSFCTLEGITV